MKTYMVVERFRPGERAAVYERLAASGRLLPPGLDYVSSWVGAHTDICFQLMRTADPSLFPVWFARWEDLVAFELFEIA